MVKKCQEFIKILPPGSTWYLKNKCRRQSGKGTVVAHVKQVHLCMDLSRDAQTLKFSLEASVGTAGIPIQQVHQCSMYRDSYGRCSRTSRPLTRVLTQSDASDVFRAHFIVVSLSVTMKLSIELGSTARYQYPELFLHHEIWAR